MAPPPNQRLSFSLSLTLSLSLSLSLCASHAHTPHGQGPSTRAWRIASGCVPGRWALHFPPHSHREANEHVIKQTIVASSWCILEHLAADRSFGRFSLWTAKLARASASHCSESNSADCCGLLPSQPQSMVVAEQAKRRGGWQLSPVGLARNLVGDVFLVAAGRQGEIETHPPLQLCFGGGGRQLQDLVASRHETSIGVGVTRVCIHSVLQATPCGENCQWKESGVRTKHGVARGKSYRMLCMKHMCVVFVGVAAHTLVATCWIPAKTHHSQHWCLDVSGQ